MCCDVAYLTLPQQARRIEGPAAQHLPLRIVRQAVHAPLVPRQLHRWLGEGRRADVGLPIDVILEGRGVESHRRVVVVVVVVAAARTLRGGLGVGGVGHFLHVQLGGGGGDVGHFLLFRRVGDACNFLLFRRGLLGDFLLVEVRLEAFREVRLQPVRREAALLEGGLELGHCRFCSIRWLVGAPCIIDSRGSDCVHILPFIFFTLISFVMVAVRPWCSGEREEVQGGWRGGRAAEVWRILSAVYNTAVAVGGSSDSPKQFCDRKAIRKRSLR